MFLKLRIIFTVLAALCLAVIIPAAVWGGFLWFGICGGAALLFFALMLLCKQSQEHAERETTQSNQADFLSETTDKDE